MKFSITEDSWILDQLHPAEWHFLCQLPSVAEGEGLSPERTQEVMLPSPLSDKTDSDEAEFLEDWNEFVKPDLKDAFQAARTVVARDLTDVKACDPPTLLIPENATEDERAAIEEFEAQTWRQLEINLEDAENWYSALNQARLMMNEDFEIAEDDRRFSIERMKDEGDELDSHRALLLAQYEFYSVIQSILIDQIIQP